VITEPRQDTATVPPSVEYVAVTGSLPWFCGGGLQLDEDGEVGPLWSSPGRREPPADGRGSGETGWGAAAPTADAGRMGAWRAGKGWLMTTPRPVATTGRLVPAVAGGPRAPEAAPDAGGAPDGSPGSQPRGGTPAANAACTPLAGIVGL